MKNNLNQLLQCPNCNSLNVDIKLKEKEGEEGYIYNNPITKIRSQVYTCKCKDCGYEHEFHYGYEKQFLPFQPFPANDLNDIRILSIYQSDSPLEKNYKIVSLENSIYDEKNKQEIIYLLFIEGEEYPVLLSKETIEEIINDPPKIHTLIKRTHLKRNQTKNH
ncbi:MAG: hypothetical protein IJI60_05220 [Bacilli bacterium]|nr:hypothetical protein [Bacilli bacterium]